MAKGYWITFYRAVNDPEALAAYAALAGPAILAGGGKFLVRGTPVKAAENGVLQRTVISEFPSVEAAVKTYEGEAYQAALAQLTLGAVDRDIRIIEGSD
jgi:uncharacterized protein (DUF1330 family)